MKKRIDPKLPIAPVAGDDPAVELMKPDRYGDRLVRRLNELFRETDDGTIAVYDEDVYLGQASGINFLGANVTAAFETALQGVVDVTVTGGAGGGSATAEVITAIASEDITAGQFVAVFNSSGTAKCRVAKASSGQGYQADGFVRSSFLTNATATIYLAGSVNHTGGTGLTAGDVFLGSDGFATVTAPTTAGYISQQIGMAESATSVAFEPMPDILIATTATAGTGTTISQTFTSSTTFVIPVGAAWLTMTGAGGGGGSSTAASGQAGGGGGSGEYCQNFLIPTTAGETLTITIGAKGTGGTAGSDGTDGGTTSVACLAGTFSVLGGKKGLGAGSGGNGGGPRGGAVTAGVPALGTAETPVHFGGGAGGPGGANASTAGTAGAGGPGRLTGGAGGTNNANGGGGGGGAASVWGPGGAGGNGNAAGSSASATSYGAGGGAGGGNNGVSKAGGDGAPGYVMLMYVA